MRSERSEHSVDSDLRSLASTAERERPRRQELVAYVPPRCARGQAPCACLALANARSRTGPTAPLLLVRVSSDLLPLCSPKMGDSQIEEPISKSKFDFSNSYTGVDTNWRKYAGSRFKAVWASVYRVNFCQEHFPSHPSHCPPASRPCAH